MSKATPKQQPTTAELCINTIRTLSMDAVQKANSGHPGLPMGTASIAYTLWTRHMQYDPQDPAWPNRDRFVLSAGHGSMLIYSLLHLTGYEAMSLDELKNFRQLGSKTAGHPEYGHVPGVETMRTDARSDSSGMCVIEHAPWGVVCMVLPVTHSAPTLASNAINVIAAGNTAVFSPHPAGARVAAPIQEPAPRRHR